MKIFRYLLVLLLVLGCAKDEPVPTTGNLRGKITDAETSSPLKDVNVEIGGSSYTTGSDGSYFFNNLIAQTYSVSVSKTGYIADSKSVQVRAEQTIISDFILSKNLPQIQPSSVTITDEDGSKSVTLKNTQTDPIGFSTQASKSWIEVSPSTGSIAANSQTIITITINFEEIDFGEYNENVVINVSGSSLSIPVIISKSQPSFINILQPQENGIYAPEEIMSITWESNLEGTVDINLLRSGNSSIFKVISEEVQNNEGGSFNWTIPQIDQGQYRVQVVSNEDVSVSDITGNFIIGVDPSIPFIEQDQEFSYVEAQEAGFVIGTLSASDDIGIELFEIISGNSQGYFEVSPTGKILLTESGATSPANDFEDEPNQFTLSIKAIDGDSNESNPVDVILKVVDSDDQAPIVAEGQSFTYSEGQPLDYIMGVVEAEDNVAIKSFTITSGNTQGYFAISDSGEISLTAEGVNSPANDYENEPNAFTIKVTASDQSGNVSDEVSIDIIVVDIDDIAPTIDEGQSFDYDEGQSSGYQIGTVVAQDNIGIKQFRIIEGNDGNYFTIDNDGILTLTAIGANSASNDFEIEPNQFALKVIALDEAGNQSNESDVQVRVNDVEEQSSGLVLFLDAGNSSSYNGSNTWYDLSGNENNAELFNTTFSSDSGGSLYFDGTATADIEKVFYNNGWKNYTITFWTRITNLSKTSQTFFNTIPHDGESFGWNWQDSGDLTHFKQNVPDNENVWDVISAHKFGGNLIEENKWVNISLVLDDNTYTYYINGENVDQLTVNNQNTTGLTGLRLGNIKDFGQNEFLIGNIATFKIYDKTLSDSEVLQEYNNLSTRFSNDARFYKDSNGVTIKCENCSPGDSGSVDGVTYTAVSRDQLDSLLASNSDLTKVCTTLVTDMSYLFEDRTNFNQDISSWDTSNVTNMKMMFRVARAFNQNISSWDTSKVTTMEGMFYGASGFNKPLNNWDVSNVQDFQSMFTTADLFNQPIGDWDTASAINISDMFFSADRFNQNINDWDVSNVVYMHGVFWGAHAFNQPLDKWDTSKVITTTYMFAGAYEGYSTFNQDISSWDVSNVEEMQYMFSFNKDFNMPLNGWDVSKVRNMREMFSGAQSFTQNLNEWDTSSVTDMEGMFRGDYRVTPAIINPFNGDISTWNTSKVVNMTYMFANSEFNNPIGNWNVESVVNFTTMFAGNKVFNQPIGNWQTSSVGNTHAMFEGAESFDQDISGWNVSRVGDFSRMFNGAESFNQDISTWDVSMGSNFEFMFFDAISFNQDLDDWNIASATSMRYMFAASDGKEHSFNGNLSTWYSNNLSYIDHMFKNAVSFNSPIEGWNVSKVRDFTQVFTRAFSFNQSLNSWDVAKGEIFDSMFYSAWEFNGNIADWNTSQATSFKFMFLDTRAFDVDISNWNTSSVTNMRDMFRYSKVFNQNIGTWSVQNVSLMGEMFRDAELFNQNLSGWCVENIGSEPNNFALGSALQSDYYPVWGTCPIPSERLIAFYPFNGDANDKSGNSNDGSVTGATLTTDRNGNENSAYYFGDNCEDRIDVDLDTSSIAESQAFTFSIWYYYNGNGCNSPRLFEFWPGSNNATRFVAGGEKDNAPFIYLGVSGSSVGGSWESKPNAWTHLVFAVDSDSFEVYQDGELIASGTTNISVELPSDVAFGRMNHSAWDGIDGKLDDIRLYDIKLSQEDILKLYNE